MLIVCVLISALIYGCSGDNPLEGVFGKQGGEPGSYDGNLNKYFFGWETMDKDDPQMFDEGPFLNLTELMTDKEDIKTKPEELIYPEEYTEEIDMLVYGVDTKKSGNLSDTETLEYSMITYTVNAWDNADKLRDYGITTHQIKGLDTEEPELRSIYTPYHMSEEFLGKESDSLKIGYDSGGNYDDAFIESQYKNIYTFVDPETVADFHQKDDGWEGAFKFMSARFSDAIKYIDRWDMKDDKIILYERIKVKDDGEPSVNGDDNMIHVISVIYNIKIDPAKNESWLSYEGYASP